MTNGNEVAAFEACFARHVGAKYAVALCNGTATLHTALAAMGVQPGDKVAVPPLTMASTTIAVLQAGAVPVFVDVDVRTWLMDEAEAFQHAWSIPVDLYGLHGGHGPIPTQVFDSAQTMRRYRGGTPCGFQSYSFQASKILALGEGGMLVTDDPVLAKVAREFSSLGYPMAANRPRIDPASIKSPTAVRHQFYPAWNYRMSDHVAHVGIKRLLDVPALLDERAAAAAFYEQAVSGCKWITPQYVPSGWKHDYWTYAVALESAELWQPFVDAINRHGGEIPYGAWRITYQEPAFRHLAEDGTCPVAEDLQPRLVQFQTNDVSRAIKNADAVAAAIKEIG